MPHKTYNEMVVEHIEFLQKEGLDVDSLEIDSDFVRCREIGARGQRGELSYKTTSTKMNNGLIGLATWCRGNNGEAKFKNYGLKQIEGEQPPVIEKPKAKEKMEAASNDKEAAASKAEIFWKYSDFHGASDYLANKGVGSYGLRFRSTTEYGNSAIVPMRDEKGKLWSYQILNPDGKKRFPKDSRTEGLFHCLASLINGKPFGIAESYATAATCYELTGIPTACAFYCHNLVSVAKILRKKYPDSPIVFFSDNDRHLPSNQGVLHAQEAFDEIKDNAVLAIPDFSGCEVSKSASDWNDLVRLRGKDEAMRQLSLLGLTEKIERGEKNQ